MFAPNKLALVAVFLATLLVALFVSAPSVPVSTALASSITMPAYTTVENAGSPLTKRMLLNFVNSGCVDNAGTGATDCTLSNSTGGGGITVFSGATALSGTLYFPIGGGSLPSATETIATTFAPNTATVAFFYVNISAPPGAGSTITFTWRKNTVSQSLTCAITGAVATSCSDVIHSFTANAGDSLAIQAVATGSAIAGTPNLIMSAQFGTTGATGIVSTATQFQVGEYLANGTTISGVSIPNCADTSGQHVNFNSATGVYTCGTSSSTVSPTTNQNIRTIGATFDGGGSALTGTLTRCVNVYEAGTISQVVLIADASGSVTVDVQTVLQSAYTGPGSASSITAGDIPALSAAVRFSDTTLTGWTTALAANTVACFVMSAPTTVKWVNATVKFAAN